VTLRILILTCTLVAEEHSAASRAAVNLLDENLREAQK
jgi:hypothetical protein